MVKVTLLISEKKKIWIFESARSVFQRLALLWGKMWYGAELLKLQCVYEPFGDGVKIEIPMQSAWCDA